MAWNPLVTKAALGPKKSPHKPGARFSHPQGPRLRISSRWLQKRQRRAIPTTDPGHRIRERPFPCQAVGQSISDPPTYSCQANPLKHMGTPSPFSLLLPQKPLVTLSGNPAVSTFGGTPSQELHTTYPPPFLLPLHGFRRRSGIQVTQSTLNNLSSRQAWPCQAVFSPSGQGLPAQMFSGPTVTNPLLRTKRPFPGGGGGISIKHGVESEFPAIGKEAVVGKLRMAPGLLPIYFATTARECQNISDCSQGPGCQGTGCSNLSLLCTQQPTCSKSTARWEETSKQDGLSEAHGSSASVGHSQFPCLPGPKLFASSATARVQKFCDDEFCDFLQCPFSPSWQLAEDREEGITPRQPLSKAQVCPKSLWLPNTFYPQIPP